ncbi:MAG: hypothetical protein ACKOPE_09950 [Novosphingobium sp.]
MRMIATTLAVLLLAGCSGGKSADALATEGAAAATATASPSAKPTTKPSDKPLTAESCIEDNKGLGTGTRGENTKTCLVDACDQGDKKSCDIAKSFGGADGLEGAGEPAPEEEPDQ